MLHEFLSTYVYDGCLSEENHDTLNKYTMYLGKIKHMGYIYMNVLNVTIS